MLPLTCSASEFSYKNFSLGYLNGSAELPQNVATFIGTNQDLDIEGFQLDGQLELAPKFFGFLSYQDGDIDNNAGSLDLSALTEGLGAYIPLSKEADLQYSAGYRHSKWELGGFDQEIGHITANVGIRWSPVEWLELHPSITHYFPVNDDDFIEAVQGTYADFRIYVTASDTFQPYVGVSYNLQEDSGSTLGDLELFQVGMRFSF